MAVMAAPHRTFLAEVMHERDYELEGAASLVGTVGEIAVVAAVPDMRRNTKATQVIA